MNSDGHDSLTAMSSEFIAEIKDDLASLEPDLLVMEEKGANVDDELINHAFRSIHSIKGGAGFIDFKELSSLGHSMENVLMRVREKKLIITPKIVDALLSGFDKMKFMVDSMGSKTTYDYEEQKTALENILYPNPGKHENKTKNQDNPKIKSKDEKTATQALKPMSDKKCFQDKVFLVDKNRLEKALAAQKFIYAIHIKLKKDVSIIEDIKSIGDILFSDSDNRTGSDNLKDEQDGFFCVVATILDLPLLSQVLEISTEQMALVDRQFTDYETILKAQSPKVEAKAEPQKNIEIPAETSFVKSSTSQTIRINVDLISRLMNRAGELVLSRNQLRPFIEEYGEKSSNAGNMMQNLDMVTTDIQEAIMQMRMQPVIDLLGKYKRVVRDIARRISKKVDFVLDGADVEVDRTVLEKLANPVTHLIRNCIDHGIELPEERLKRHKPESGTIHIKAFHQGGHVHIVIEDDGDGIDPQLVLSKAFEKGLVAEDQLDKLTDKQKIDLIFLPGFSTSKEITDISGRGVGMDVVKTNIERLRGQIEIDSVKGEGTSVHLIIPLTLAIVPSLIVSTGTSKFAIPQVSIKEVAYLEPGQIHSQVENIAGSEVFRLRENLFPVLRLRNVLGIKTYIRNQITGKNQEEKRKMIVDRRQKFDNCDTLDKRSEQLDRRDSQWDSTFIIILKLGTNFFGLCVDELYDIEEVVAEPLSEYVKHLKFFAGATILGDGDVIMTLDIPGIASSSQLRFDTIKSEQFKRNQLEEEVNEKKGRKRNLIIFGNGGKEYFALELKDVTRLEPIRLSDIHNTGSMKYLEYNNHAVSLFSMDEFLPASVFEYNMEEAFAIFPKHTSAKVGIIASKIIDTIETNEILNKDATCSGAVLGKLFVDDMMVQVLDHKQFTDLIDNKVLIAKDMA